MGRADRALTPWERALIARLLGTDAPGSRELRAQLPSARVEDLCGGECGCRGRCGSIALVVDPASPPARTWSPFAVEAMVTAANGTVVEAVLFLHDGRLAMLEVIWHDDDATPRPPPPLPAWRRGWLARSTPRVGGCTSGFPPSGSHPT